MGNQKKKKALRRNNQLRSTKQAEGNNLVPWSPGLVLLATAAEAQDKQRSLFSSLDSMYYFQNTNGTKNMHPLPPDETARLNDVLTRQVEHLTRRNEYLEQIIARQSQHLGRPVNQDDQTPERCPTAYKHLAGSRVTFGEIAITLPNRASSNPPSDVPISSQTSPCSSEEPYYTPDSSVTQPLPSESDPLPSYNAEKILEEHDPRSFPLHCVRKAANGLMTFCSPDGSLEVDIELRFSSLRQLRSSHERLTPSEEHDRQARWQLDVPLEPRLRPLA